MIDATIFDLDQALETIAERALDHDVSGDWPALDIASLHRVDAMRWAIGSEFGGKGLPPFPLHLQYEKLAAASVATALIVTQRDAAAGLIESATDFPRRRELLARLARNEIWATVGIAQLTTSRQGSSPAVLARKVAHGYRLDGVVPWCSGALHSQFIVIGAGTEAGEQILVLLPSDFPGVKIGQPLNLVALSATHTGPIELQNVCIDDGLLLRGPCASALAGRRNSLALGQSFIATGLTQAALKLIARHDSDRAKVAVDRFTAQLNELRSEIKRLCASGAEAEAAHANARVRGQCNNLVARVTQAAVAIYKGTALLRDHPGQRLAREALFLLVWSCPNSVIDCTVDLLSEP